VLINLNTLLYHGTSLSLPYLLLPHAMSSHLILQIHPPLTFISPLTYSPSHTFTSSLSSSPHLHLSSRTLPSSYLHLTSQILLPALMLHGSYDFFLFASSYLSIILEKDGLYLEVGALIIAVILTICGSIFAYRGFKKVN
jgi:hypothetical protein